MKRFLGRKSTEMNHADAITQLAKFVGFPIVSRKYMGETETESEPEVMVGISLERATLQQKVDAILEYLGLVVVVPSKPKCVKRSSRGNFPAGATKVPEAPTCVVRPEDEEGPL